MNTNLKRCKTCGLKENFNDGSPGCFKFKIPVDPETDFCKWHIPESGLIGCSFCSQPQPLKETFIHTFNDKIFVLCKNCHSLIGTCHTCAKQNDCGFMADKSEPQVVMQTVRQGMVTMQTQVKNPNLVQKHCISCKCSWGTEGNCIKEANGDGCNSWSLLLELLQRGSQ